MAETVQQHRGARFRDTVARYGNPSPDLTHAIRTATTSGYDWVVPVDLGQGRGEVLTVIDGGARLDDPHAEAEVHRFLCEEYDRARVHG